jgi:hypothetical protein
MGHFRSLRKVPLFDGRRVRHAVARLVTVLACLLAAGCQGGNAPKADAQAKLSFDPSPPHVGKTAVTLKLTDPDGKPLKGGEIELEGNMNHAGMKPVFANLKETQPGRYEGTLDFTMGGDWFVLVRGKLPDGRRVDEKVDVPGVKVR